MERILQDYQPADVLAFFEDICAIPHGSGNEAPLADYVEAFALARGLYCYRDEVHNVFIKRSAAEGCEEAPAVLFQGHLDMVCVKDPDVVHDFEKDGLKLAVKDGWVCAQGTTLGGDNGIAVAMMLALLDNPPEKHPAIECLFTVSEETGLEGAHAFDPVTAGVTAKTMINMDSEEEGVITAGCSGGVRTDMIIANFLAQEVIGIPVRIRLSGFSGGHSGIEINKGHTNAIKAMGRILAAVWREFGLELMSVDGGGKDNAIPGECEAVVLVSDTSKADAFCACVRAEAELIRSEPQIIPADKSFSCEVERLADGKYPTISCPERVVDRLAWIRDGVLSMHGQKEGLVAYSRNLGIVKTLRDEDGVPTGVQLSFATRSANEHHLDENQREMAYWCNDGYVTATHHARYPGWDYAPVSPLRDLWTKVSEELYGVTPAVDVIHAGLECGILASKMPGMDIISVGPDLKDVHTPRERFSMASLERTYRIICGVLQELA